MKQLITEVQPGLCRGSVPQLFGQAFQRIGEFPPHMGPAARHCNLRRQLAVVRAISIGMQKSREAFQKPAGTLSRPAGLVIVQNHRPFGVPRGSVHPHIAFLLCLPSRLPQHHQRGLVGMEDLVGQQLPAEYLEEIRKPPFIGRDDPVGHGLPGNGHTQPGQFLLLPV